MAASVRRMGGRSSLWVLVVAMTPTAALSLPGQRLETAIGPRAGVVHEAAIAQPRGTTRVGLRWVHANDPIVAVGPDGQVAARLLGSLGVLESYGAVMLTDRLMLGAVVPVSVYAVGDEVRASGVPRSTLSPALGDLRFVLSAALVPRTGDGFGLALTLPVTAPTGPTESSLGEGAATFGARLGAEYGLGVMRLAAHLGYKGRAEQRLLDAVVDDTAQFGASIDWAWLSDLSTEAAIDGDTSVRSPLGSQGNQRIEALFRVAHGEQTGPRVGATFGSALFDGVGTARWRAMVDVSWTWAPSPDGPRTADIAQRSPRPGSRVAPPPVASTTDAPALRPLPAVFAVPEQPPQPVATTPARTPAAATQSDQRPTRVGDAWIADSMVLTGRPLSVSMGARPRLTPTTRALLADVAALLAVHPEVGRLRIEGHSDSSSDEAMSQRASLEWATQAAALLTELGVEPHRLQPVGVGDAQPIESNRTDEGRAANRRLELHIELSVER